MTTALSPSVLSPSGLAGSMTQSDLQSPVPAHRWLTVLTHLDRRFGGLSTAVPNLAATVASDPEYAVSLAAFCIPDEIYDHASLAKLAVSTWPASRGAWLSQPTLSSQFKSLIRASSGVHIHGLWEQSTFIAARLAGAASIPYILSAHGMLESWAVNHKRLKKALYSALVERANVQGAAALHALTTTEAQDYRRFGASRPIAIIPNGVDIPLTRNPGLFLAKFPALRGKRILLFLSRIHPKKGVDILIEAWSKVARHHADAHLVLAGPDFESTQSKVEALIASHHLEDHVLFTGMLDEPLKSSALAAADCFVLPSYSEGLSLAALEAMAASLPVILTDRCNLDHVARHGAGWVVPATALTLQSALEEVLENDLASNCAIGARGRSLVQSTYSWPHVASQMRDLYSFVEGGAIPTSFELLTGKEIRP